jgi:hypothetical protein
VFRLSPLGEKAAMAPLKNRTLYPWRPGSEGRIHPEGDEPKPERGCAARGAETAARKEEVAVLFSGFETHEWRAKER